MISRAEFWAVMEAYGAHISPAQAVLYAAAILITGWLFARPGKTQSLLTKLYLAIAFTWTGVAFYLVLASDMAGDSIANYIFGGAFIVVAALFAVDVFRQRMQFRLPAAGWRRYATLALAVLVLCYPLFGIVLGHSLASLMVPGAFPCPTVALGLLLLTTALPHVNRTIYILLLICAIPFTPFVQIARYGVYEDTILFTTGVYSLILLVMDWKRAGDSQKCVSDPQGGAA
jgi:hypothetical protein